MWCPRCGAPAAHSDLFCPRCGTPLRSDYPPGPGIPQPPPQQGHRNLVVLLVVAAVVILAAGTGVGVLVANHGDHATSANGKTAQKTPATSTTTSTQPRSAARSPSPSAAQAVTFSSIYAKEQSGVVRIEVLGCSDSGIGSGFLLSPTLVATVDHVVTQSVVVSLVDGDQHTTGRVIGSDPAHDLALVQADQPLTGYHFHFATTAPQVGDRVAAVGFPIGGPITLTQGGISGLDRDITVDGQPRAGLLETDTPINPGNSGGPLLGADGSVVALVDAQETDANGIGYAVPYNQAQPEMASWQQAPVPAPPASCSAPLGPSQDTTSLPTIPQLSADASAGVISALTTYFDSINQGDYETAWNVLSARLRGNGSYEALANGDATSYDFDLGVLDAKQTSATAATVGLQFTSIQDPSKGPNGDSCDVWTLNYSMIQDTAGTWNIDATTPYHGTSHTSC